MWVYRTKSLWSRDIDENAHLTRYEWDLVVSLAVSSGRTVWCIVILYYCAFKDSLVKAAGLCCFYTQLFYNLFFGLCQKCPVWSVKERKQRINGGVKTVEKIHRAVSWTWDTSLSDRLEWDSLSLYVSLFKLFPSAFLESCIEVDRWLYSGMILFYYEKVVCVLHFL